MRFVYHGVELEMFDHTYNTTALNERAVEIAVAMQFDRTGSGLEVGNVLSHYGIGGHRVVDRYEQADGVENIDVFNADVGGRGGYDWIVALSTIEHVGWDERPRDPDLAGDAIDLLASMRAPGGRMLVTVPGGYHPPLDEYLATGAGSSRCCTLVRDGASWRQTDELAFLPYGLSTSWAESVWIGEW